MQHICLKRDGSLSSPNIKEHPAFSISNYIQLDKRYTEEEYKGLSEDLKATFFFPFIDAAIKHYLLGSFDSFDKTQPGVVASLSFWMYNHDRNSFNIMYELPIVEMPLYINYEGSIWGVIAKWRLRVGKRAAYKIFDQT